MIILDSTKTLTMVLAATATTQPQAVIPYADATDTTLLEAQTEVDLNSTTPVTAVAAPASGTRRVIKSIYFVNRDNITHSVIVKANGFELARATITAGQSVDILAPTTQAAAGAVPAHVHAGGDVTTGTIAPLRMGSGSPSATTFLRGDNTWQTPAGGGGLGIITLSSVLTASATASSDLTLCDSHLDSGFTITLPTAVSATGKQYGVKKVDAYVNKVRVVGTSSQTLDGAAYFDILNQNDLVWFVSDGANWYVGN